MKIPPNSPEIEGQIIRLIEKCICAVLEKKGRLDKDELLPDATTAKILGISKGTLPVWRHKGKGPRYVKIGSRVRYRYRDLLAYIEQHSVEENK